MCNDRDDCKKCDENVCGNNPDYQCFEPIEDNKQICDKKDDTCYWIDVGACQTPEGNFLCDKHYEDYLHGKD